MVYFYCMSFSRWSCVFLSRFGIVHCIQYSHLFSFPQCRYNYFWSSSSSSSSSLMMISFYHLIYHHSGCHCYCLLVIHPLWFWKPSWPNHCKPLRATLFNTAKSSPSIPAVLVRWRFGSWTFSSWIHQSNPVKIWTFTFGTLSVPMEYLHLVQSISNHISGRIQPEMYGNVTIINLNQDHVGWIPCPQPQKSTNILFLLKVNFAPIRSSLMVRFCVRHW